MLNAFRQRLRLGRGLVREVWAHPLTRQHPLRALSRELRTYILLRISPDASTVIRYIDGARMHCPRAAGSVRICGRWGLGEYESMGFCLHVLRPGDLFGDIGANAGTYTILAARSVGCRVIAVEPVRRTYNLLMQNVYLNDVANLVDARQQGVGAQHGELQFTASLWSLNHVADADDGATVGVAVRTIDQTFAARAPTVIKIDIEGFEVEALKGAAHTLHDPELSAVVIEIADGLLARYGASRSDIKHLLSQVGFFGPYWYDPRQRKLTAPGNGRDRCYNHIYVRDPNRIAALTRSAAFHHVNGVDV